MNIYKNLILDTKEKLLNLQLKKLSKKGKTIKSISPLIDELDTFLDKFPQISFITYFDSIEQEFGKLFKNLEEMVNKNKSYFSPNVNSIILEFVEACERKFKIHKEYSQTKTKLDILKKNKTEYLLSKLEIYIKLLNLENEKHRIFSEEIAENNKEIIFISATEPQKISDSSLRIIELNSSYFSVLGYFEELETLMSEKLQKHTSENKIKKILTSIINTIKKYESIIKTNKDIKELRIKLKQLESKLLEE